MAHNCVLQVSGIPCNRYDNDQVLDKLFIHFLRRKNGGNGEVDVRYPTEVEGVAMLTFDLVDVAARVLTRSHQLEIERRTYPLEVSRPQMIASAVQDQALTRRHQLEIERRTYPLEVSHSQMIASAVEDQALTRRHQLEMEERTYPLEVSRPQIIASAVEDQALTRRHQLEIEGRTYPLEVSHSQMIASAVADQALTRRHQLEIEGRTYPLEVSHSQMIASAVADQALTRRHQLEMEERTYPLEVSHPQMIASAVKDQALTRRHQLEIERRTYPLEVSRPQMTASAVEDQALTRRHQLEIEGRTYPLEVSHSQMIASAVADQALTRRHQLEVEERSYLPEASHPQMIVSAVEDQALTRRHQLEVEERTYPLEVSHTQHQKTQVFIHVTTSLSLEYFSDISEVRRLLEKHNLNVLGEEKVYLHIKGDFQDLSRCRDELYKKLSSSSFLGQYTENRMSRRDIGYTKEYIPDKYQISREEHANMRKSNGKRSPTDSLPDTTLHKNVRNPSPIRTRKTSESLPAEHDGYSSTSDKNQPPFIKPLLTHNRRPARSSVGSSQRKPKDASSDDSLHITKRPNIAANLNLYPLPPKKTPAEWDRRPDKNSPPASSGKPTDSSRLASQTAFTSTQFGEDLPKSKQPKCVFAADSISSQSKPKGSIADDSAFNPKYPNNTINDNSNCNLRQAKETSKDDIAAIQNVHPSPHKETFPNKDRSQDNNLLLAGNREPSDSHSALSSIQNEYDRSKSRKPNATHVADSSNSQCKPKSTTVNELTSYLKHANSTNRDCWDGQPKDTSSSESDFIPRHSKITSGDITNINTGKHKNTSPEDNNVKSRNPKDLSAGSAYPSSLMAAGWSSPTSSTISSSTATNFRQHLDQIPLSTEIFMDPAVLTYVTEFRKDKLRDILTKSDVEMKIENCEGFNKVILIAKSPDHSQAFYKAVHEISDLFNKCQHVLRAQSIDLSNISNDVTKKLQKFLFHGDIRSSPDKNRLQMIGPSADVHKFMEQWTSAKGDYERFQHLAQEGSAPGSPRPPAIGMDTSTTHNHRATQNVQAQRTRPRGRSVEPAARRGSTGQDTNYRSKTPDVRPWK